MSAGSIDIQNQTQIDSSSDPVDRNHPVSGSGGSGLGGNIFLTTTGNVSVTGCNNCGVPTAIISNAFGTGKAGNITIVSGHDMSLANYSIVQSSSLGQGDAGVINFHTRNLNMTGGSQLSSDGYSSGSGGIVSLVLGGGLDIAGQGADDTGRMVPSGIFSNAYASGNGGRIDITTTTVAVHQGGEISSSSKPGATGKAGVLNVNASQAVQVSGQSPLSGIYTNALGFGDAGDLTITTPSLTISDGGLVQSQNLVSGAGGNINLIVKQLNVLSGGQISVKTKSTKSGGNINILNIDTVNIADTGSGIFATTQTSIGKGGNINIVGKSLILSDNAEISANTLGSGIGGSISIAMTDSVLMNSGATLSTQSIASNGGDAGVISIDAGSTMRMIGSSLQTNTVAAQGGNINVIARDLLYMQQSTIVSKAHVGIGSGGNITIDPTLTVMNQSQIIADAFGGNGGNIGLTTGTFLQSANSIITASSALGVNGDIIISSPALNLGSQMLILPSLNGELHIDETACAASHKHARSSFGVLRASGWRTAISDPLSGFVTSESSSKVKTNKGLRPFLAAFANDVSLDGCRN
jgi:large exoprotein involved in heme utilization and adhesion